MVREIFMFFYGLNFRDGYVKNEKLDEITKGIINIQLLNINNIEEYEFIENKELTIFKHEHKLCKHTGLISVDTKYDFGKIENEIIFIDELHICDSCRY